MQHSRLTCYVEDLARTAEFYETIGFRRGKEEPDRATFYVNWFFVTGEPQLRPSGNREFVLRDPDGYKLVFFQKK
jgi:catechol 2,3-dioxygenase-like lactoylglutathione lyase family enzyme